ncbi:hypothetical protein GCM10011344_15090 [Dokdonia pacifica]|uniref:Uncharacterized protein n=1 Tax=Dokdonia pacifica TaxID=1627892 RepID=A0A238W3Q3_9FLAO|nr:hypothetical protein [Dokdonia pacifica]GGG15506.1 hypothetical protein GCM10011344_15090 [Dokdonia pacifica]SNR40803.1 hypothetical protein SAMN06265376_101634 [Dokdonia pacifica]
MGYYESDETWNALGIKTKEEFVEKYVVVGKFHDNVPDDIVKSYITISYIMAHSYFHYPMYDEAMSKALLVMEMAVKLKAKQLSIDVKLPPNKKGVVRDKNLSTLIDEMCAIDELSFLKSDFDRARNIRNMKMHPDQRSLMGIAGRTNNNIMLFINIINQLFLDTKTLKKVHQKNNQLETALSAFQKGLYVFECHKGKLLVDVVYLFKYFQKGNRKLLLLYVNPVITNAYNSLTEHRFNKPLIVGLTEFKIDKMTIVGKEDNGCVFKMYVTKKKNDVELLKQYNADIDKVSQNDIDMFKQINSQEALWNLEKKVYENCWSEKEFN